MTREKAKENYLRQRLNCAQAIVEAFKERFQLTDRELEKYLNYGGGGGPSGLCGAYAAAKDLLEKYHPERLPEFEKHFFDSAKSLKCGEIRKLRKLSCVGCVEKAAEFICATPEK